MTTPPMFLSLDFKSILHAKPSLHRLTVFPTETLVDCSGRVTCRTQKDFVFSKTPSLNNPGTGPEAGEAVKFSPSTLIGQNGNSL